MKKCGQDLQLYESTAQLGHAYCLLASISPTFNQILDGCNWSPTERQEKHILCTFMVKNKHYSQMRLNQDRRQYSPRQKKKTSHSPKTSRQGTQNDSYNFRKDTLAYTLQSTLYAFNPQILKKSMVWNLSSLLQGLSTISSRAQVYNTEG